MANRKIPFGYEMRLGKIQVNPEEACVVRDIFTMYADGTSYRQLTEYLNAKPVRYSAQDKPWNKNMVARILANGVYAGDSGYPAILTSEERLRAVSAKPATGTPLDPSQDVKAVRRLAKCSTCGSAVTLSSNRYGWARWNCPACAAITADAVSPKILNTVTAILNTIRRDPEIIHMPPSDPLDQDKFSQSEQEFSEMLNILELDETEAKTKALALAEARLNALGSEDYETMRIRHILANAEQRDDLDAGLLRQITSTILIHPFGAVSIKFKNGQIVEGRDSE